MTPFQQKTTAAEQPASQPTGIRGWNARQIRFLLRYGSLYHVPITPDTIAPLASRYAAKHPITRPRMLQPVK